MGHSLFVNPYIIRINEAYSNSCLQNLKLSPRNEKHASLLLSSVKSTFSKSATVILPTLYVISKIEM